MNKAPLYTKLSNAILTHHYRWGKGDVRQVRVFADGRIEVEAQRTGMAPHVARGRLWNGRTIRMYGRQFTVDALDAPR